MEFGVTVTWTSLRQPAAVKMCATVEMAFSRAARSDLVDLMDPREILDLLTASIAPSRSTTLAPHGFRDRGRRQRRGYILSGFGNPRLNGFKKIPD